MHVIVRVCAHMLMRMRVPDMSALRCGGLGLSDLSLKWRQRRPAQRASISPAQRQAAHAPGQHVL